MGLDLWLVLKRMGCPGVGWLVDADMFAYLQRCGWGVCVRLGCWVPCLAFCLDNLIGLSDVYILQ